MAKTKEELDKIKKEVEELNNKLSELTQEELQQVSGGTNIWDVNVKHKVKVQ